MTKKDDVLQNLDIYQNLVKPTIFKKAENEDKSNIDIEVCPIQKGFGVTLGNSLRRVLLSSIGGSCISSISFNDSIKSEFSEIPNIKEGVQFIISRMKEVVVRSDSDCNGFIKLKGPCKVFSSSIQFDNPNAKVLSNDYLFTITNEIEVIIKIGVKIGIGYRESSFSFDDAKTGKTIIPIDCVFSPVKNVSFSVSDAVYGEYNDYDKLNLNIKTNGSISGHDALSYASAILRSYLLDFVNFDDSSFMSSAKSLEEKDVSLSKNSKNLNIKLSDLELSVRSEKCLKAMGIKCLGHLASFTENELMSTPNFGKKSLTEINELLSNFNLSLGSVDWSKEDNDKLN